MLHKNRTPPPPRRHQLYDARSKNLVQRFESHAGVVNSVDFHASGNFLISSSSDSTLKVWDLREGQLFYTLHGHEGATMCAGFSPAGDYFASGGADEQVMVWKTNFDRAVEDYVMASAVPATSGAGGAFPLRPASAPPAAIPSSAVRPATASGRFGQGRGLGEVTQDSSIAYGGQPAAPPPPPLPRAGPAAAGEELSRVEPLVLLTPPTDFTDDLLS